MIPHRIRIKYFLENQADLVPEALIPVFHQWIQEQQRKALLIDVALYTHVPEGPGILLVGFEADYALDFERGIGLAYTWKRTEGNSLQEVIQEAWHQAVLGGRLLQEDPALSDWFKVDPRIIEITVLDRLRFPNQKASLELIEPAVAEVASGLLGETAFQTNWVSDDPCHVLAVKIVAEARVSLEEQQQALELTSLPVSEQP